MTTKMPNSNDNLPPWLPRILFGALLALVVTGILVGGYVLSATVLGQKILGGFNWLFGLGSVQLWWFVTRSAGVMAYLLLWFSTVWGLAVPSKLLDPLLERGYTFDFHQFISLLSIGFVLLHVLVLTVDRYLPYSVWQILIPFLSPYRPVWVGLGVISFYIIALVTITFYLRSRIGMNAFRAIHIASLFGYLGVTFHAFYAGTDTPLLAMQLLYRGTALVLIFFTVYWLVQKYQQKQSAREKTAAQAAAPTPRRISAH